jgi:hypothetical protein
MMSKDPRLLRLLEHLDLEARQWVVVDHWPADRTAIGIAAKHAPLRLVYVSVFDAPEGTFDYECEVPSGPQPVDYETGASGQGVTLGELEAILVQHFAGG